MKIIARVGAVILFLSVCSLESTGAWWVVILGVSAASLLAIHAACGRLDCYSSSSSSMNSTDQSSTSR
jgi:hypothetical protein